MDFFDSSEIKQIAMKYMRKQIRLFDINLNILTPIGCLKAATTDSHYTVLLILKAEVNICEDVENLISELVLEIDSYNERK